MITEQKLIPYKALVLYRSGDHFENIEYAEITEYREGEPSNVYPATIDFFKELGKNYQENNIQSYSADFLSKGKPVKILSLKINNRNDNLVFMTYPQKRKLLFREEHMSGYYHVPALIWKAQRPSSLWVAALMDHRDISHETAVFHAPFMNISNNGNVCLGSSYWPEDFRSDMFMLCTEIVDAFFESKFTHFNSKQVTAGNYFSVLEKLKSMEKFPKEELVPMENVKNVKEFMYGV